MRERKEVNGVRISEHRTRIQITKLVKHIHWAAMPYIPPPLIVTHAERNRRHTLVDAGRPGALLIDAGHPRALKIDAGRPRALKIDAGCPRALLIDAGRPRALQ